MKCDGCQHDSEYECPYCHMLFQHEGCWDKHECPGQDAADEMVAKAWLAESRANEYGAT